MLFVEGPLKDSLHFYLIENKFLVKFQKVWFLDLGAKYQRSVFWKKNSGFP